MRKLSGCLSLVFILFYQAVSAQDTIELVNSGEIIEQGINLSNDGKYKEAIGLYKEVSRSDTNYNNALHELSYSSYLDSQFEVSISYAKEGLILFPEMANSWYNLLANSYDGLKNSEQALAYYDSSIKLNPYGYLTWFNKGILLYNDGKKEQAKACFQRAILINPYHPSSHYYLGVICYEQGKIPQAMLSFSTNLIISPEGRYRNNAVNYLSRLSKITDDVNDNASKATETTDDNFALQQEIILSKASLDTKYKLQTDVEDPITRQLQVLLEKLQYDANDSGFWMQYYVPIYTQLYKSGQFNTLVNYMFSGLDIKSVKNYNAKNKTEIETLTNNLEDYFNAIRRTENAAYANRSKENFKYYYGDDGLIGIGKWTNEGKSDILSGPWQFFYNNGQEKSKGNFNEKAEKDGDWSFYYSSGKLKEKSSYKNDKPEGKVTVWFDNGNLSEEDFYTNGEINGELKTYYFNGLLKSTEHYTDNMKNGEAKSYTFDGFPNYIANYKNDELEGEAKLFYKTGKIKELKNYAAGELNGVYKHYNEKGILDMDGNYVKGKPFGEWKEYYDAQKIKSSYTYTDAGIDGIYKTYYENGKLFQTIEYSKNKIDGKEEDYDEDGIKYRESVYDKGTLKELTYFDKTGKVISSSTTRKGAANLTFFDAQGNKTSEGYYNKDGYEDGKATYYFPSGKIQSQLNYKNGLRDGERTIYYADGTVLEKINFTDDNENGLITDYFNNAKLKYSGYYVDGEKQGEHRQYNSFGTLTASSYYLNDELNGYVVYYSANGKKQYEEKYRTGWLIKATQFDSTGKVLAEASFPDGNGELIYRHLNGNVFVKINYRNYLMQGKYESFYFDGTPSIIQYYNKGLQDSVEKKYYYGGKPSYEGKYVLGKKEGAWKFYFTSGKINYIQNYSNDKLEGNFLVYNEDGTKDKEIHYHNNMLDGACVLYGENNKMAVQLNFHNDKLISYTYEGKDGKPVTPIPVKNGTALITAYYNNGNKSAEINYEENMESGVRKIYFSNGQIYVDDNRIYNEENGAKKYTIQMAK